MNKTISRLAALSLVMTIGLLLLPDSLVQGNWLIVGGIYMSVVIPSGFAMIIIDRKIRSGR